MSPPPPLPRQLHQFKLACRLGILFGIVQSAVSGIVLVSAQLGPLGPFPVGVLFICVATALQAVSAAFLLRNQRWALAPFALVSILVVFGYLAVLLFPFAALNIAPLILLALSATPIFPKSPPATVDPTLKTPRKRNQDPY